MTIYKIRHSIAWWHEVAQQEKLLTPGNIFTLWSLFWASRASRRLKYVTKQHPLNKQKVRNPFCLRVFRTHTCSLLWICPWVCSTGELDQIRWRIHGVPPKEKIHWERGAKRGTGKKGGFGENKLMRKQRLLTSSIDLGTWPTNILMASGSGPLSFTLPTLPPPCPFLVLCWPIVSIPNSSLCAKSSDLLDRHSLALALSESVKFTKSDFWKQFSYWVVLVKKMA